MLKSEEILSLNVQNSPVAHQSRSLTELHMNKERCTQIEKEAYCNKGWPEKCSLKGPVKLYASFAAELDCYAKEVGY